MRNVLVIIVVALSLFVIGCTTPSACLAFCERMSVWADACNVTDERADYGRCLDVYTTPRTSGNLLLRRKSECWSNLTTWIIASGSDKLDCSKPPPTYLNVEKEQ